MITSVDIQSTKYVEYMRLMWWPKPNTISTSNDDNVIYGKDTCVNDSMLNQEYDFAENVGSITASTDTSFIF